MLYLVLGLVLAAFGLLITALTTANTLWAWLSVVLSIGAAGVLVYDWLQNRRDAEQAPRAAAAEPVSDHLEADRSEPVAPVTATGSAPAVHADPELTQVDAVPVNPEDEPPEEATDATDVLVVSGLYAEVHVIDERPRYHLAKCPWVGGRPTMPLPVSEARQLGFTPCAVCGPDAVLARRHREGSGAR